MTNYYIGRYQTGLVDSADAAHELLETKIESLDPTGNPIVGMGVLLTRRDREQAIGWLLWSGFNILRADHEMTSGEPTLFSVLGAAHATVSDNLTVTTNP